MAEANPLLQQLQGVRGFILYALVQQPTGSLDKVPTDPYTGRPCDPHEPAHWMLPEEAQLWADQYGEGYGVGFVISEQITLPNGLRAFCVDIDKCRDGNTWAPHATNFCARFPGAFFECSVSGNGLHIFASYRGDRPAHGVKNRVYKIELYTRLRFIAITGAGAIGSILVDHTETLHKFAAEFFPERDDADYGDTLTEAPVPEWSGPEDDDELIRRAMRSHSAAAIFGGKASFADLFTANVVALARVFPAFKNTPYDESAADLALANHAAFWTGNNGVRMERIMRRSALVRAKWERPGYLVSTINLACGSQRQWYKDPRATEGTHEAQAMQLAPTVSQTAAQIAAGPPATTDNGIAGALAHVSPLPLPGQRPDVGALLIVREQLALFEGCVYVQDVHQVMLPQGYMLSSERFDAEFSGYTFIVTNDGTRPAKRAWDAFVHSECYAFPKVKGTFFDPRVQPRSIIEREGWRYINSWVPIDIPRGVGDVSPYLNHLKRILPKGNDAEILLAYFAACVQYPGVKFQWWPLIQGVEGNGKTLLSVLLEKAIGQRYTHWPKASEVGSKFNAAFYGKILILVEDIYISEARGSLWETLKPMITGSRLEIESKGVDKVTREVCFNGILNTNHKNGIRKTRNDRRIGPFFCSQQHVSDLDRDGLTEEYFNWFKDWCFGPGGPIVADFLMSYKIPDQWNPATTAIRAPRTTATEEAITAGLGPVEQEVQEAIDQGAKGFRGGWVSSVALDILLARLGKTTTIPHNKRRELLEAIGYTPHPALPDGRSIALDTDGSRPRLFVRKDSSEFNERDPQRILQLFQIAQK